MTSRTQARLTDALEAAARSVGEERLRPLGSGPARRRRSLVAPAAAAMSVMVIIGVALALSPIAHRGSPSSAVGVAPVVDVGDFPTGIALDAAYHTIYVSASGGDELSLINSSTCNASDQAGCAHVGQAASGGLDPIGVAVDEQTHTVYVVNAASNSVAVINAATCNAADTGGCARPPAQVRVPSGPEFLAINPQTNTIYVADTTSDTVAVIDGNTCNASDTTGCSRAPATVYVGAGPFPIAVDTATNTVYVGVSTGVAVIDGNTCDASDTAGCSGEPAMMTLASLPAGIAVDQAAGTVYVSGESGEVAAIGLGACDSADAAGCAVPPATAAAGLDSRGDVADPASGTIYVTNAGSGTVSMINAARCNAADPAGCGSALPAFPVGASPRRAAVDAETHTLYVVNTGASTLSVINSLTCNASDTRGCPTKPAPAAGAAATTASTCGPAVQASTSGEPAGAFTRSSSEVASGSVGGQAWTLWARRGAVGVNAIEDGGLVLDGRWYGLCAGFPNVAEMELVNVGARGIDYGFVAISGNVTVTLTSGSAVPAPQVHRLGGLTFFIGQLPRSACSYPAMVLHAAGRLDSAVHTLSLGACQPGHLVAITQSTGEWGPGYAGGNP
jgi:DNA-binding beta-propeller fold protein YncE